MSDKASKGSGDIAEADEATTPADSGAAGGDPPAEPAGGALDDTTEPVPADAIDDDDTVDDGDIAIEVEHADDGGAAERIGELEAELAEVIKARDDNWDRLLRATADLDNVRKRSRREVEDGRIEARTQVLKEMLPVIDNLERAVQHAESTKNGSEEAHGIVEGVKLVLRQFGQALERCDVHAVDDVGTPFDPNVHEAISQAPTADYPAGTVCQALQRGYTIGKRLLRPALVVVATAPPAAESAAPAPADDPPADEPVEGELAVVDDPPDNGDGEAD